ncbi:hypothetical protein [Actinomadura nitritigenes]|uniref:hypothetical protein n=1 Tax=Actinomadura nitritigenes TaxID=134602 RepID=UPI003D8B8D8F
MTWTIIGGIPTLHRSPAVRASAAGIVVKNWCSASREDPRGSATSPFQWKKSLSGSTCHHGQRTATV